MFYKEGKNEKQNLFFSCFFHWNFYVSDMETLRIQKYSPEGKYLLTIGRKGQGPGEFRSLSVVRFGKDDNLYICDVTVQLVNLTSILPTLLLS